MNGKTMKIKNECYIFGNYWLHLILFYVRISKEFHPKEFRDFWAFCNGQLLQLFFFMLLVLSKSDNYWWSWCISFIIKTAIHLVFSFHFSKIKVMYIYLLYVLQNIFIHFDFFYQPRRHLKIFEERYLLPKT